MSRSMNFSLVLDARDRSQGGINSLLGGIRKVVSFAKDATIGLAGINFGIRPLVGELDNVIERGTRLNAVRASLAGIANVDPSKAQNLGRALQFSSHGVLGLAESMQTLNKGLAAGLDFRSLQKIADYGSRKALSIGEEPAEMIKGLVDAIATGKTKMLDDLGLLRDGVEGVQRAFDSLHGAGSFAALPETAKVAQVARAVLSDMERQQKRLGVSAGDSYFIWKSLKTEIGDSVDQLAAAVTKSEKFQNSLKDVRGFIGGITQHFEKGGSLGELFMGKGKSGGLLGLLGAGLKDLMTNAGLLLGAGILRAIAAAIPILEQLGTTIGKNIRKALGFGDGSSGSGGGIFDSVAKMFGGGGDGGDSWLSTGANIVGLLGGAWGGGKLLKSFLGRGAAKSAASAGAEAAGAAGGTALSRLNVIQKESDAIVRNMERTMMEGGGAAAGRTGWRAAVGRAGSLLSRGLAVVTAVDLGSLGILAAQREVIDQHEAEENAEAVEVAQRIRREALRKRREAAFDLKRRGRQPLPAGGAGIGFMPGVGFIPVGPMLTLSGAMGVAGTEPSLSDQLNATADKLEGQAGWGGASAEYGNFLQEFPPLNASAVTNQANSDLLFAATRTAAEGEYQLNPSAYNRRRNDFIRAGQVIGNFEAGKSTAGMRAYGEARKLAQRYMAEKVRQGYRLTAEQREKNKLDANDYVTGGRINAAEDARAAMAGELDVQRYLRRGETEGETFSEYAQRTRRSRPDAVAAWIEPFVKKLEEAQESSKQLLDKMGEVIKALTSSASDIRRATA